MKEVKVKAYAKVNLSLDITGRRPDGYHELRSVMQEISLCDEVILRNAESGIKLKVSSSGGPGCSHEEVPEDARNLAYRAAELLLADAGLSGGVEIELRKRIPAAAGLAGGSTDAAAVLRGLCVLYMLDHEEEDLCRLGVKLGADVPFCIRGGTALAEGIGDKLTRMPSPQGVHLLLVKPPIAVSTAKVYGDYDAIAEGRIPLETEGLLQLLKSGKADAGSLAPFLGNALAAVTEEQHPSIAQIREAMLAEGAEGALMSGSGPSVFGLFDSEEAAQRAMERLRGQYPDSFAAVCGLCDGHKEI
ncbi:MAG: 4-(cytidine 5'-diphospho)-2-C-methyl-D-erythritol kinase [Lachnospiraceae bacterium]|nr:4-(cytidine 5'-diphospho)-2-C-methyl-D-erythritol kinase [Lachnospiraceae bacterium]